MLRASSESLAKRRIRRIRSARWSFLGLTAQTISLMASTELRETSAMSDSRSVISESNFRACTLRTLLFPIRGKCGDYPF